MRRYFLSAIVSILLALPGAGALASDLDTPILVPELVVRDRLNSGSVLKTGIRLAPMSDLVFEPEVGLRHAIRERELKSGYDEVTHKIHAQAGGRVDLFGLFSLSAAAKLPVYTVAFSDRWLAGSFSQPGEFRHDYDILNHPDRLSWTGEMGINLGPTVLNIFYDKSHFDDLTGSGDLSRYEEMFGTRLIFRFK